MSAGGPHPGDHHHRLNVVLREGETVSPLELFFDLVFVLAITQCTALMATDASWTTIAQGLVVLGLLWWAWAGYAWLTSVMNPAEGGVRIVLFAAMAALLVTSLSVPDAFGAAGLTFAVAYTAVRAAHIALFVLASHHDAGLRHSVVGLGVSSAIGAAVLIGGAAALDGSARLLVWLAALVFDVAGPLFIDTSGWRLVPKHFAERHGLIVIVALGESIVAIGVGAGPSVAAGVVAAAIAGMAVAAALWWAYFDATARLAADRLASEQNLTERNEMARDAYSYLHLPIVAAIVLVALGMKSTLAHVTDPLTWETSAALAGGVALYLVAHALFIRRTTRTVGVRRLVVAAALVACVPLGREVDAVVTVAAVAAVLWALLASERITG